MDVRMPDGTVVKNVPDGVTKEDLLERYAQFRAPRERSIGQDILQQGKQALSGVVEGAAGLLNLPMDFTRAAGELAGVNPKFLPLSTSEVLSGLNRAGVTADEPQDFGEKSVRFAGSVLGGAAAIPVRAPNVVRQAAESAADDLLRPAGVRAAANAGYHIPKANLKDSIGTNLIERAGGKQAIEATARVKDQAVTNRLAAKALGLPESSTISPQLLQSIRAEAGEAYRAIDDLGRINADSLYKSSLARISKEFSGAADDFPELASAQVKKLTSALDKEAISSKGALEMVKNLRRSANDNLSFNATAENKLLGKAQRAAADTIEDLIERNIGPKLGKDVLKSYRDARKLIAKTYTVESALNPATGNIVATEIARQAKRGKPLDGDLKRIADFARAYGHLAREQATAPSSGGVLFPSLVGAGGIAAAGPIGAVTAAVPILGRPIARRFGTTVPRLQEPQIRRPLFLRRSVLGIGGASSQED